MAHVTPGAAAAFGEFAPDLVHLTDDVLFGEVWAGEGLGARDRSLATVSALVATGSLEQLRFHLQYARQNGVTDAELVATITHLAFYAGWPKAMGAMALAKELLAEEGTA